MKSQTGVRVHAHWGEVLQKVRVTLSKGVMIIDCFKEINGQILTFPSQFPGVFFLNLEDHRWIENLSELQVRKHGFYGQLCYYTGYDPEQILSLTPLTTVFFQELDDP